MKQHFKLLLGLSFVFAFVGCEDYKERKKGRVLRRSASLLGVHAASLYKENVVDINLSEIVNDQMLTEINNSDYFVSHDAFSSPMSFSNKIDFYNRKNGKAFKSLRDNRESAVCTKNLPDVLIAGSVTDFEMGNGADLRIGLGGITSGILPGISFGVKKMKMELDLHLYEPLTLKATGASVYKRGTKTDWKFGVDLNIGGIGTGIGINLPQSVSKVTRKTLRKTIDALGLKAEQQAESGTHEEWSARVFAEDDTHILINAGKKHGLKIGDYLWISNMDYTWLGEPCTSRLLFQRLRNNIDKPVAVVQVDSIGIDSVEARVLEEFSSGDEIVEGAKAFIGRLDAVAQN